MSNRKLEKKLKYIMDELNDFRDKIDETLLELEAIEERLLESEEDEEYQEGY